MSFRVLAALTAMLLLTVSVPVLVQQTAERTTTENFGVGDPDVFVKRYLAFRAERLKSGSPDVLTIPIGFVKGLSRSFTGAAGEALLDLRAGVVTANLRGLAAGVPHSVWLVDGGTLREPDQTVKLGDVASGRQSASVSRTIAAAIPPGFMIDRIIVARGIESADRVVASGSLNVFQKLFARRASLRNESTESVLFVDGGRAPAFADVVGDLERETADAEPVVAGRLARLASALLPAVEAAPGLGVPIDRAISQGGKLFFQNRFGGNGRTCGTCHPASNNFTLDPAFIATLPPNDPLFVAEFNKNLAGLERPQLMRQYGLILENVDGLEDPTTKFVMRGVPHTLGLPMSLEAPSTSGPAEMTGWSGDGAPGNGSLRDFAIGAVTQHFTRSLARRRGIDFVLPNEHQLDMMEAFQRSLGRDADFDLGALTFSDPDVQNGLVLFNTSGPTPNNGRCAFCHSNAGALSAVDGPNRNFNTNVEDVMHPARGDVGDENFPFFPFDGGFGQTLNTAGTYGDRTFNTASVVEAADTAPFFHNNVAATLEDVIDVYTGPFSAARTTGKFVFDDTQKANLVNFMRAINTLQNINVAKRELEEILALSGDPQNEIASRLVTAHSDTGNAIVVLGEGGIFPAAVDDLAAAQQFVTQAQQASDAATRTQRILQAVAELDEATDSMIQ